MSLEQAAPAAALAAQLISISKNTLRLEERDASDTAPCKPPPPQAAGHLADAPVALQLPPFIDLRPLNGLRAVCSIAVVLFHCWLGLWNGLLPFETTSVISRNHWFVR